MRIGRQDRQTVRGRHIDAATHNHVAIAIAVGCHTNIGRIRAVHQIDQTFGPHRVRVRVTTAKVRFRVTIDDTAPGRAQPVFENRTCVRSSDRMHRVKTDGKPGRKKRRNAIKIKQPFHQVQIVGDWVNDRNLHLREIKFDWH